MLRYFTVAIFTIGLFIASLTPLFAQNTLFSKVDEHARKTPQEFTRNTSVLAGYLTSPFPTEIEKSRAIFTWITENIAYDTASFFAGRIQPSDPQLTLNQRKATCGGYSALFLELATLAGLEAVIISGHSKGYGFDPATDTFSPNHEWNAVKIDGYWKLLDTTWGAGALNQEDGSFIRRFEEFYFLTNPQHLIHTHFPEDPSWQLLYPPIRLEDYKQLVNVRPGFFKHQLSLDSHKNALIDLNYDSSISIGVPENQVVTARLSRGGTELPINQVLVQHVGNRAVIELNPPQRGTYELEIFAKSSNAEGAFSKVLSYTIKSNRETADSGFPETFGRFLMQRGFVEAPISYVIPVGEEILFSLRVPGAKAVSVVNGDLWTDLVKNGEHFSGVVTTQSGLIQVAGSFDNDETYSVLLEYQAR